MENSKDCEVQMMIFFLQGEILQSSILANSHALNSLLTMMGRSFVSSSNCSHRTKSARPYDTFQDDSGRITRKISMVEPGCYNETGEGAHTLGFRHLQ